MRTLGSRRTTTCCFLKPLDKYFTKLQNNQDEFEGLVELFKPIMHLVMLVWKHSHHYNTPGRIVVLMRQICNDLIMQSQKFLPGGEIFGLEPPEAVEKLKLLLNVLGSFKSFYFEYKGRTTRDTPQNPWKFQNSALFARLDAFLERCHDISRLDADGASVQQAGARGGWRHQRQGVVRERPADPRRFRRGVGEASPG